MMYSFDCLDILTFFIHHYHLISIRLCLGPISVSLVFEILSSVLVPVLVDLDHRAMFLTPHEVADSYLKTRN